MHFEVFGLGQCVVDHIGVVDEYPAPDGKREFSDLTEQVGGPVATALATLAGWGRRCAFSGLVGDDRAGARIRADLEAAGVDTGSMVVRKGTRSQYAFVAVERGSGRRMIFWQRPTGTLGEPKAPPAGVFLSDGLYAEASVAIARDAECVVVDAGTLREGTRALLDEADVFVASEPFARDLVGADDPAGACRRMREHGARVAGVTLGRRGYVASFDSTVLERPAHAVDAVDTTGCGDIFHAGVIEGMLRGWPWERTFDFAAWAAARSATRIGNRAGVPPVDGYPIS